MPGITYDLDQTPMHELELNPSSDWRQRLGAIMDGATMQRLVTLLIIINAVILGLQTSPSIMADWGTPLLILDTFILTCFVIELVLRFTARGIGLLRDPWAVFDCLVVGIALVPASGPSRFCVPCACCGYCAWYRSIRACARWCRRYSPHCQAWAASSC